MRILSVFSTIAKMKLFHFGATGLAYILPWLVMLVPCHGVLNIFLKAVFFQKMSAFWDINAK